MHLFYLIDFAARPRGKNKKERGQKALEGRQVSVSDWRQLRALLESNCCKFCGLFLLMVFC